MPQRASTYTARLQVSDRLHRWALATDPRIVRRLWPPPPTDLARPACPVCGVPVPDGEARGAAVELPPGPAREARAALAAGGPEALTPALPIEPGERWYLVCRSCLGDGHRPAHDRGRAVGPQALVDEVLGGR
jgi:hypothetical protein